MSRIHSFVRWSALLAALAIAAPAGAQTGGPYDLRWNTFDGGGASASSGGSYFLAGGTIGQPDAGRLAGGTYELGGGFWLGGAGTVAVGDPPPSVPARFQLLPPRPNPFRAGTILTFDMPRAGPARVEIYSLAGQRVRTLLDAERPAGRHQVIWEGTDDGGRRAGSGIYFARVVAAGHRATARLVLIP